MIRHLSLLIFCLFCFLGYAQMEPLFTSAEKDSIQIQLLKKSETVVMPAEMREEYRGLINHYFGKFNALKKKGKSRETLQKEWVKINQDLDKALEKLFTEEQLEAHHAYFDDFVLEVSRRLELDGKDH